MMKFQDLPACQNEGELFQRYAGIALEKQLAFGEVVGERKWFVDMAQGTVAFDEDYLFPIQLIGTFAKDLQTWLWAWANPDENITQTMLQDALMMKQYGEEHEINLLHIQEFDFNDQNLHLMGVIASGMTNASAYYLGNYGRGIMLFTVNSDAIDKARGNTPKMMMNVFLKAIETWEMDHREAFMCYLLAKGYEVSESNEDENDFIVGELGDNVLVGYFDEESRIIEMTTELPS